MADNQNEFARQNILNLSASEKEKIVSATDCF